MDLVCDNITVLKIIYIMKLCLNIVSIIVPVILIILISIDVVKTIASGDVDTKKLFSSIKSRVIAAVIVFFVFPVLNFALSLIPDNNLYYLDCYNNATEEKIDEISVSKAEAAINDLETKLVIAEANISEATYNEAFALYQPAVEAVNDIYFKDKRLEKQEVLKTLKSRLEVVSEKVRESQRPTGESGTSNISNEDIKYIINNYPSSLSQDRIEIVKFAASMEGKIPYYYGGKATSKNFNDNNFGITVSPDIYNNTKKGLDCSAFVDFVFWHVLDNNLGNGNTDTLVEKSSTISQNELLPGDLAFKCTSRGCSNHVGIYAGKDEDGNNVWIHETTDNNNVLINNAGYLKYYRRLNNVFED